MRYRTYTLRIEQAEGKHLSQHEHDMMVGSLQDAEDVVNDHLPDGFYCKIDETGEGVDLAAVRALEQMGGAA